MPLSTEADLGLGHIGLDPRKWHSSPPLFSPCLQWPQSPISATAELLFTFSKMAAVRHLGFVMRVFGPPTKATWCSLSLSKTGLESMQ